MRDTGGLGHPDLVLNDAAKLAVKAFAERVGDRPPNIDEVIARLRRILGPRVVESERATRGPEPSPRR